MLQEAHGTAMMRPRARLIGLLGDELISDEPVALVELVKNAYDADARRVSIRFEGVDYPERIVVEDNGLGMSLDTVLNAWFEPGTVSKKRDSRSPAGRTYQGAKGIGRFASARLGDTLLMETQSSGSDGVSVFISWGRFSDETYLDSVSLDYSTGTISDLPQGTRLTIEGVKPGIWDEDAFKKLHARLSRLISPFEEVADFQIELQIPGHPELSGCVDPPPALREPKYQMEGEISPDGLLTATISVDGNVQKVVSGHQVMPSGEAPSCGPFSFEIRAWDRDREGLEPIAARFDTSVALLRQVLNRYSGVSIYRDGFRVYPYGEAGNDWLQLDLRSRQRPGQNLANNQIVAAIRLSRESNPELKDRSAREGMIRNAAHDALEAWFKASIQQLEEVRYKLRPKQEGRQQKDNLFEAFDFTAAIAKVREQLGENNPAVKLLEETEKQVSEGVERIQDVFSRLLLSAGLGHMVDVVIHEIGAPLGKINRQLEILERDVTSVIGDPPPDNFRKSFSSIRAWSEHIFNLRQRLEPHTAGRRGKATSFLVKEEVELALSLYEALLARQRIACSIEQPDGDISVKMSAAAFGQVIANLIDNAIYWTTFAHGHGKGGSLLVRIRRIDKGFAVSVHDDGPGVSDDDEEKIFDSYYSKKPNGMGLGLYIARLVIEPYGRVVYLGKSAMGGASFEAMFEQGVGL